MPQEHNFIIKEETGRLDKVLTELLPSITRSHIQQWIKEGNVTVNGENLKANYKVQPSDEIVIIEPELVSLEVLASILSGTLTSLLCIFVMSLLWGLNHSMYVTLLPKSITTAMGIGVSEELNGYVTITVAVIMVTGILGNIIGELVIKIFRIRESVSKGVALGTASHAIGTSKAMEIGDVEGAMGSLSIAVAGILTVILAPVFANFL